MLEETINNLKKNIDEQAETEKKQIDFIANQFNENKEILEEYKEKYKLSDWEAYHTLESIIKSLGTNFHLESKIGYSKIKDVLNSIYVKIGYYKIQSDKKLDLEKSCNNCCLTQTKKGLKVYEQYKKI